MKPGQAIFTSSAVFTVPKGVKEIDIFCVGGGAAGSCGVFAGFGWIMGSSNGGGGGGGYTSTTKLKVNPFDTIDISIGSGGSSSNGSDTIAGDCNASGGCCSGNWNGGNGGSGGGNGSYQTANTVSSGDYPSLKSSIKATDGACDGNDSNGKGQGTTTRAFGDVDGTLYSGGGGGAGCYGIGVNYRDWYPAANGGGGNGGFDSTSNGSQGGENTGGGGGGAACVWVNPGWGSMSVGPGGSGIAIIRWGY